MNVLLVLGMFPGFMSMIAVYFILKAMGLTNSLFALILVYSGSAGLSYYICKGFFDTIPRAMEEAAFLDGARATRNLFQNYAAACQTDNRLHDSYVVHRAVVRFHFREHYNKRQRKIHAFSGFVQADQRRKERLQQQFHGILRGSKHRRRHYRNAVHEHAEILRFRRNGRRRQVTSSPKNAANAYFRSIFLTFPPESFTISS